MNEPIMNTQAQSQSFLDKATTYKKLGLKAQVQYEREQARRVDPYLVVMVGQGPILGIASSNPFSVFHRRNMTWATR